MQQRTALQEIQNQRATILTELDQLSKHFTSLEHPDQPENQELYAIRQEAIGLQKTLSEMSVKFQNAMVGILAKLKEDFEKEDTADEEFVALEKSNDEKNKKQWEVIRDVLLKGVSNGAPLLTHDMLTDQLKEPRAFDRLIDHVNQALQNVKHAKTLQTLLKKNPVVNDFVKLEWDHKSKKYVLSLTPAGEKLRDHIFQEERLKQIEMAHDNALALLRENVTAQQQELNEFSKKILNCKKQYVEKLNNIHKEKSKPLRGDVKQLRASFKELRQKMSEQQANIQRLRVDKIALSAENCDREKLESMRSQMVSAIEEAERSVSADQVTRLLKQTDVLLKDAKDFASQGKYEYGAGKTWDVLSEKMRTESAELDQLTPEFLSSLNQLRLDKAKLDHQIAAFKAAEPEPMEVIEPLTPANIEPSVKFTIAADPESDEATVNRYLQKTENYSADLSKDMLMRLAAFRESCEKIYKNQQVNQYFALLSVLELDTSAELSVVLDALKNLYDINNKKDETLRKSKVNEILMRKDVDQEALQHALHKYRLTTELKRELEKPGITFEEKLDGFINKLRMPNNFNFLVKHRDISFMTFIRGCGAAVAAIFGLNKKSAQEPPKMHYPGMFSPRGKQYANNILDEEKIRSVKRKRATEEVQPGKQARFV